MSLEPKPLLTIHNPVSAEALLKITTCVMEVFKDRAPFAAESPWPCEFPDDAGVGTLTYFAAETKE